MTYDYNTAGEQRAFEVMPDGTIAVLQINIREGGAGEHGIMKRTKNGDAEALVLNSPSSKDRSPSANFGSSM